METGDFEPTPPLSVPSSPLPSQEDIVAFAEQYSLNLASKRFGVSAATIKRWMKSSSVPLTPKYNSPGQGRKISYSAELEHEMAEHIHDQLSRGERVTMQSVCSYARNRVQEELPEFVASTGWANRFLARNNIDLSEQRELRKEMSTTPQRDARGSDSRGRPLSYSIETDQAIANYVRQKLASGYSLTNSELRRYAKEIILKENRKFTGSASWAQNFLHRHKINLQGVDMKESAASTSPSPTVPSRVSPASPSTPLLPALPGQSQFPNTALPSSPRFTSAIPGVAATSVTDSSHLNPATEMHVVASSSPGFPNPALSDSVMNLPAEYAADDPIKQALAILTGENIDPAMLTVEQVAALQSTLSELTSDTVSLVELLNTAQQIHEQSGESGSLAAHLIAHGLDSTTSGLYLGLNTSSDVFASGLTGAAATQVNPNTQAPTVPNPPRIAASVHEVDPNHTSRPLSYAKETDMMLAKWVQEQQAVGKKVTFASLRAYAKNLVSSENPNFNASVGWVTPFLLRHGLDLSINKKKTPRKADSSLGLDERGPLHSPPLPKHTPPSAVHHIMQDPEEHPLTPEQMMVPVQVVSPPGASDEPTLISGPPTTLEGIRVVLEQGMQTLTPDCTMGDQVQLAAQLQEQSFALSHTSTPLASGGIPQDMHVVTIDTQSLSEDLQRQRTLVRKFRPHDDATEQKLSVRKRVKGQRSRHRLSEKLDVVRLMREHSLAPHFVCRMLGIANSTLAGWIKLVQQKGAELEALSANKKRSNLSGQGRPLTYSREKDAAIAQWIQTQQKLGVQVMPAELAKYAQSVIREENPNFTASSGWAQKFLQRHGLQLTGKGSATGSHSCTGSPVSVGALGTSGTCSPNPSPATAAVIHDQQEIPAAVQTEEVIAHEYSQERPYPEEMEKHLVAWTKENVAAHGSLSLQELCRYAEEVVIPQNPMFVASLSWTFMFLYTHNILLDPKPNIASIRSTPNSRKRTLSTQKESPDAAAQVDPASTPKRPCTDPVSDMTVSPSTGNLCEALLALSNQSQESGQPSASSVQAVLQVALRALHQQQQQQQQEQQQEIEQTKEQQVPLEVQVEGLVGEAAELVKASETVPESGKEDEPLPCSATEVSVETKSTASSGAKEKTAKGKGAGKAASPEKEGSTNTYFGKSAREFSLEEKEEVVRYANATTLQKAAMKYGVAAPTVWRWRVELKLHQPKYSAMQKKYIIKFAETNSLKEAAQRYGITGKTISNWRKALQADGELSSDVNSMLVQDAQGEVIENASGAGEAQSSSEVVFHFVVDGGEVVEVTGTVGSGMIEAEEGAVDTSTQGEPPVVPTEDGESGNVPLEVTTDVDIENVGMEYDVVSSEGHAAKPRCTPQEKVQILQYALDHTIKEASQKFGVSPGTLYYWKRTRNSGGKESSKEPLSTSSSMQQTTPSRNAASVAGKMDDGANLMASDSEEMVVQPEQFIAGSDSVTSVSDAQAATIQSISQALAGMPAEALQHLNPDLTLLQAVSSLLAGGVAGGEGEGGGGEKEKTGSGNSNSEGISSPTEVLVRPYPAAQEETGAKDGAVSQSEGEEIEEGEMDDTPHVVLEEVVTMGDELHGPPNGGTAPSEPPVQGGEEAMEEAQDSHKGSATPVTSTASVTAKEATSIITQQAPAGSVHNKDTPSEPGSEEGSTAVELVSLNTDKAAPSTSVPSSGDKLNVTDSTTRGVVDSSVGRLSPPKTRRSTRNK